MKAPYLALLCLLCSIASHAQHASTQLQQQLKGGWYYGNSYEYCTLQFDDSTVCCVDIRPARWYKYTLSNDTLQVFNLDEECCGLDAVIKFAGDALIMMDLQEPDMPAEVYYPFGAIVIDGRKITFPAYNDGNAERKFDAIIEGLAKQPINRQRVRQWRDLLLFTDGAVAEHAHDCLSALYKKRPQPFLTWIYEHKDLEDETIRLLVFGGLEEIVGSPTKAQVEADIQKMRGSDCKDYLTRMLDKWPLE